MDRLKNRNRINLLPQEQRDIRGLRFFSGVAVRVSLAILGIYLAATIGLFSAIFLSGQELASLETTNNGLTATLEAGRNKEGLLFTLKNRVTLAGVVYDKQTSLPSEAIERVLSVLPSDIELRSIENQDGKNVFLTVTALDSKAVLNFLTILKNDQRFSSASLNTFGLREEGSYSLSLELK